MSENILTFAKIVVGGAGLWLTGGASLATASAVLGLAEDATKLREALGAAGLHDVEKRLTAQVAKIRRDLENSGDFRGKALADAEALFAQALPHCLPDPAVMVEHDLEPEKVAHWMLRQIALSSVARDFREAQDAERYLLAVTVPVLKALVDDKEFREVKLRTLIDQRKLRIASESNALLHGLNADRLAQLKAAGVLEGRLIAIAQRTSREISDPDQAVKLFADLVELAIDDKQRGAQIANVDDWVTEALKRVRALSDAGQFDESSAEAAKAFAVWQDKQVLAKQEGLMILDAKIVQDRFRLNALAIAECEQQKVALELTDQPERFAAIHVIRANYYERGRDKGINFDLQVSVALARLALALALGPDQRGATQNHIGNALQELGTRDGDTALLQQSAEAYRAALLEYARERVPLAWAATQNNLGAALSQLGTRDGDTALLQQSAEAYRAALLERTRERVPLDWAKTQNNLGNALSKLGNRDGDTVLLLEAVAAYRAALLEMTRERVPLDWAMTQNNLGAALSQLGTRDGDTALLQQSAEAYRAALLERTRERVPLDWAATQYNLGITLSQLGTRDGDTALLQQAAEADRAALLEYTRERVPLDWAMAQNNLSFNHLALFHLTADLADWHAARDAIALALDLLRSADAPAYLAIADATLADILAARPPGEPE